ncbi:MAG: type ISP restriction/modification enzyme [Thermodesulfobacteriota bacterium]|nr:type ISP restriction/modification enzyme [Thermodesulfobacteriota bacterium]
MNQLIDQYCKNIQQHFQTGLSTEHSYRADLQSLLQNLVKGIMVTNEPKRQKCGAPDYIIQKKEVPIGYIEAKDIGVNLDKIEKSNQLKRYKGSLDNLILTDYLEFRFFKYGEKVNTIAIAECKDAIIYILAENFDSFFTHITDFCTFTGQTITSSEELAKMMAQKARMMEEVLYKAVTNEDEDNTLRQQLLAFKQILIHDLSEEQFADIYAQTIAYGLFAARLHDTTLDNFSREEAVFLLPKTNPFLQQLFTYVAGTDLDDRVVWIVEDLANIFRATDVKQLLSDFGKATQQNDPFLHFYETFLAEYNPKLRKSRGVYYTPEPIVNFIVRAVDDILKIEFGLPQGLADTSKTRIKADKIKVDWKKSSSKKTTREVHKVQILDPATGTGTFLAEVIRQIYKKFSGQQGIWASYIVNDLIPRLNGFEILMAPYTMCHIKLDMLLKHTGFPQENYKKQRLRVFLANSLEEARADLEPIYAFAHWLSTEAFEADYVKKDTPVMVVLGNPPYSGHSSNQGEWLGTLLKDYKQEPGGGKLKEKNSKWLNDDYVKFIRYGQHCVEKNGSGVLAFVNNHSFLDNPTFRGMRWHLLKTFDKIYIIDLHGNSKKKEACPDGTPDQNVFDIQQGVSINLFIKTGGKKRNKLGQAYHYDLYGNRESKYSFLWQNSLADINFKKLDSSGPQYFFVAKNFAARKKYDQGFSVNDLFLVSGNGIVTKRDNLTIHYSENDAMQAASDIINLEKERFYAKYNLPNDVRDWKYEWAKQDILNNYKGPKTIEKISYRPFDTRNIVYTGRARGFIGWPVRDVMKNYIGRENYGLLVSRMTKGLPFAHCFITKHISEAIFLSSITSTNAFNHPIYTYCDESDFSGQNDSVVERKPNLRKEIVSEIAEKTGIKFTPEDEKGEKTFSPINLLDYIYAVLHSPTYREAYKEFLFIDFPRIPYPKNRDSFWKLVLLGSELRLLHLLESPVVKNHITTYPIVGDNIITRQIVKNDFEIIDAQKRLGRVWINDNQYFDSVSAVAWNFMIGGYQPAQKWLKNRKGKELIPEDVQHYQKIIVALTETNRIMKKIDEVLIL